MDDRFREMERYRAQGCRFPGLHPSQYCDCFVSRKESDALKAEVERLRAENEALTLGMADQLHFDMKAVVSGTPESRLLAERDTLKAEVERLRISEEHVQAECSAMHDALQDLSCTLSEVDDEDCSSIGLPRDQWCARCGALTASAGTRLLAELHARRVLDEEHTEACREADRREVCGADCICGLAERREEALRALEELKC